MGAALDLDRTRCRSRKDAGREGGGKWSIYITEGLVVGAVWDFGAGWTWTAATGGFGRTLAPAVARAIRSFVGSSSTSYVRQAYSNEALDDTLGGLDISGGSVEMKPGSNPGCVSAVG